MPRNPENRRVDIVFSPEQFEVLLWYAEDKGYIVLPEGGSEDDKAAKGSVSAFVRDHLSETIPGFALAKPVVERGKYKRNRKLSEGA